MIVYHGSNVIVKHPDTKHSFRSLDFGKGFYATTVKEQAERWARRKADIYGADRAIVTVYDMAEDMDGLICKSFGEDLTEWIDFVCRCRDERKEYLQYDLIKGKVAKKQAYALRTCLFLCVPSREAGFRKYTLWTGGNNRSGACCFCHR